MVTGETSGEFYDARGCAHHDEQLDSGNTMNQVFFRLTLFHDSHDTSVISFLEVLGQIGGLYEILYLTSSFFLGKITKFLFQRDIKKIERKIRNTDDWFSYPYEMNDPEKTGKNKIMNLKEFDKDSEQPHRFMSYLPEDRKSASASDRNIEYQEKNQENVQNSFDMVDIKKNMDLNLQINKE